MELALPAVVAREVVGGDGGAAGVLLGEDLGLLEELEGHGEVLLLQVDHG